MSIDLLIKLLYARKPGCAILGYRIENATENHYAVVYRPSLHSPHVRIRLAGLFTDDVRYITDKPTDPQSELAASTLQMWKPSSLELTIAQHHLQRRLS